LNGYKGAEVNSGEEQWEYFSDGRVKSLSGNFLYVWDGEFLQPSDPDYNFGTGKWDGLNLWWFPPMGNSFFSLKNRSSDSYYCKTPSSHYIYNASNQEFISGLVEKDWKWTRHFLASRGTGLEWRVEGEIPKPVVMFLELLRSTKDAKSSDSPSKLQAKANSRTVSISMLLNEMEIPQ
jgi:hypothetical protein